MKKFTSIIAAAIMLFGMAACSLNDDGGSERKNSAVSQGTVVKNGLTINGTTYDKTSEVCVVPAGTTAAVEMTDDSSWSSFVAESAAAFWKGVFLKDRKLKLSPFVMGQYPVTRDLYKAVMGEDPSIAEADCDETKGINPVNYVSWFNAIIFCNKLSALEGLDPVYSYEIGGADETDPEKWVKATDILGALPISISSAHYKNWRDNVKIDIKKNGYRLPTEVEWEFAARGGDTTKPEWKYAFSGINTKDGAKINDGTQYLNEDENLPDYGWYEGNSNGTTHTVGTKKYNTLNIYDMSGNVCEWCNDFYNIDPTYSDSEYMNNGYVTDPLGAASGEDRILRGGGWNDVAISCSVTRRDVRSSPNLRLKAGGFRLVRSAK